MSGPGDSISQDASGHGAIAAQIIGDHNKLTIIGGGTRLVLDRKHLYAGDRPPRNERELLLTEWRATALVGRRHELDSFKAWRDDPAPIAVRCVIGKAGAGKTRLAIEACEEAERDGWAVGFVAGDELARFHQAENLARWHSPKPTFVVIDDAAVSVAMIRKWFEALAQDRPEDAEKLRILLLERHAEPDSDYGWWATLVEHKSRDSRGPGDLVGAARPEPLAMLAAPEERRALFAQAMRLAAQLLGKPELEPPAPSEDPDFDRRIGDTRLENEPLFLIMAAIVAIDRGTSKALALSRVELAEDIAGLERARLARLGAARGLDPDGELLGHLAACVTLQRGCSLTAAKAMIAEEIEVMGFSTSMSPEKLSLLLAEALPSAEAGTIDRIRPDLIGEAFVIRAVLGSAARSENERFAIVVRARSREEQAVVETLILSAQDLARGAADHPAVRWLAALVERSEDVGELMRIAAALPDSTLALSELGVRVVERIVEDLRTRDAHAAEFLARWLATLGARLTNLGRREDALAAEQEALAYFRSLPVEDHDAKAEIASILNNLSVSLSGLGRREEALSAAEEAVELRRMLAMANSDAFMSDLAVSLNTLSNRLGDLGRHEEALSVMEEALELARALAAVHPDGFKSEIAGLLNNLANILSDLRRREEALSVVEEAIDLYRALAAARPDAFTPDLAMSLNNFAINLSDLGRREEALSAAEEAVNLYRVLAAARPDAFTPDLAMSLNNLATMLRLLGRREEAVSVARAAVELRRAQVAVRPDAFTPNLATSLGALGRLHDAAGESSNAMDCYGEALARLSPYFLALPMAHAQRMMMLSQDYIQSAEAAGIEPDWDMLAPIAETLMSLMEDQEKDDGD